MVGTYTASIHTLNKQGTEKIFAEAGHTVTSVRHCPALSIYVEGWCHFAGWHFCAELNSRITFAGLLMASSQLS